jgi:hypothetical protein
MLVYVRPSNEALLRARVPGAQDQHGCPLPTLFTVRVLRARRAPGHSLPILPREDNGSSLAPFPALGSRSCLNRSASGRG